KEGLNTSTSLPLKQDSINLTIGGLNSGFESSDLGLALLSSSDIFGKQAPKHRKKISLKGSAISTLAELAIGDYVVHSSHGIAVYAGLKQREVAGVVRDYALLEYAGSDKLFVPVD
ncbi:MAG: hypothetical protein HY779_05785, partial [Rubrobacteridae bacterium]|nr:hypothetical protein [Rubrobacteridae bacterium]